MDSISKFYKKEPEFVRLGKLAKYAPLTEKQQKAYRESLKIYRDNYAILETEREEGRAEGRAIGRAIGRAMARKEGIRIMLSGGISPEVIAEKFGIPTEEVIKEIPN